jgi:two-component system, NarL family, invasion response regulator UvrY
MRILIADDHGAVRKGVRQIILDEFANAEIEEAIDADSVIEKIKSKKWDLVICDHTMPGKSGLEVAQFIKKEFPQLPMLMLSIHPEEQYAIRALRAGAAGYLSKDAPNEEIIKAAHLLLLGRKYISTGVVEKLTEWLTPNSSNKNPHELLSDREFDVFNYIAKGQSISEIAQSLSISVSTVSTTRANILSKMNLKSNAEIIRYAIEHGL